MKAVIVDDEYNALLVLKTKLEDIGGVEVVGFYSNVYEFLDEVDEKRPDVIFLDIEMSGLNGFQVMEELLEKSCTPSIIFVTAFSHYAIQAFDVNALDYLVKPVAKERLIKTLARIKPSHEAVHNAQIKVDCFKYFSVSVNGECIDVLWRTKKTEELFAYLLCTKGKYVQKAKLAEDLWQELEPEKSAAIFYTTQYYLKKQFSVLGMDELVEAERGKIRIRTDQVDCDLFKFDMALQIEAKSNIEEFEDAIQLYKGMPFEDKCYSWAVEVQQEYEMDYEKLLVSVIEYYKREENADKVKYYDKKLQMLYQ